MEFYAKVKNGIFENYTFIGKELNNGQIKDVWAIGREFPAENVEILHKELIKDLTPYNLRFKRSYLKGLHKITFKNGFLEISKPKGNKTLCKFEFNSITENILK